MHLPPEAARLGLAALPAGHPDLAGIETAAGPLPLRRRTPGFAGLLPAILGQPISHAAAAAIRPRVAALERLFGKLTAGTVGGGATLGGCRLGPAPARERVFGPGTLKLSREKRT